MVPNNDKIKHKRNMIIGSLMLLMSVLCIVMTIMFIYVNNSANERIDGIREDYRRVADRRDAKVTRLSKQVAELQSQMATLPEKTAQKTADQVNQVVKEDEGK
jgi:septal ring factor EnvC (AmiA/AmiB activator)